ncbi:SEC-C domain-containing protein [Polaromonas sp. P1(28)-13]|nr:SEC-C domain-containing protein [Polaromonas sp. P1(28)-13]
MNHKIGRNDPCPCGSGRKYKHCCGQSAAPVAPAAESHEGAVERAVAWLAQHHRKAFAVALAAAMEEAVFEFFDDEDEACDAMADISDALRQNVQINLTEWLLAEGDIQVKGEHQRVAELLLGPRGPLLTTGQRAWLEQLARRPLRLYDVTEVVPGVGITVCDALDTDQLPQVVVERAGSQSLQVGMQIGARDGGGRAAPVFRSDLSVLGLERPRCAGQAARPRCRAQRARGGRHFHGRSHDHRELAGAASPARTAAGHG